jgi:hypothetical protein
MVFRFPSWASNTNFLELFYNYHSVTPAIEVAEPLERCFMMRGGKRGWVYYNHMV